MALIARKITNNSLSANSNANADYTTLVDTNVTADIQVVKLGIGLAGVLSLTPSNSKSVAYEASRLVNAGPTLLLGLSGYNTSSNDQFIQFHNAAALPANGAVPEFFFKASSLSNYNLSQGFWGRFFSLGLVICTSSTGPTKTIGVANDCWFDCQYV